VLLINQLHTTSQYTLEDFMLENWLNLKIKKTTKLSQLKQKQKLIQNLRQNQVQDLFQKEVVRISSFYD
jgi:hypothetical protein